MKFTPTGRTMGDETRPYEVRDYQAKTIVEFINEVIEQNPKEWGNIRVNNEGAIEYRYGELLQDIPDHWQYREIEKVKAFGGWSRMDYLITPKEQFTKASECKCCECGEQAVAFWPVIDPDIPSEPYCRKCLDKTKAAVIRKLLLLDANKEE